MDETYIRPAFQTHPGSFLSAWARQVLCSVLWSRGGAVNLGQCNDADVNSIRRERERSQIRNKQRFVVQKVIENILTNLIPLPAEAIYVSNPREERERRRGEARGEEDRRGIPDGGFALNFFFQSSFTPFLPIKLSERDRAPRSRGRKSEFRNYEPTCG